MTYPFSRFDDESDDVVAYSRPFQFVDVGPCDPPEPQYTGVNQCDICPYDFEQCDICEYREDPLDNDDYSDHVNDYNWQEDFFDYRDCWDLPV